MRVGGGHYIPVPGSASQHNRNSNVICGGADNAFGIHTEGIDMVHVTFITHFNQYVT